MNELDQFTAAHAISDPAERAAYLDQQARRGDEVPRAESRVSDTAGTGPDAKSEEVTPRDLLRRLC